MTRPRIQFLHFDGCPLADAARAELELALAECGIDTYEDIDILRASVPKELRAWGSPTILVDGEDVSGERRPDEVACRIYDAPGRVPRAATIVSRIRSRRTS